MRDHRFAVAGGSRLRAVDGPARAHGDLVRQNCRAHGRQSLVAMNAGERPAFRDSG
jgi:hypothetical protein